MQMSGAEEEPQSWVYSLFKVMQMPLGMHDRILPLVPPPNPIGLIDPTLLVYPPPMPSNPFLVMLGSRDPSQQSSRGITSGPGLQVSLSWPEAKGFSMPTDTHRNML